MRSVCLKKIEGKDLVDNRELLELFRTTRQVVHDYQQRHALPELEMALERLPDPATLETRPLGFEAYHYVYEIILAIIAGVVVFLSPIFGLLLILLFGSFDIGVRIYMARRNARIKDALRQIADACSAIEMLVRNNESYKSVTV